ncbi:hypothetical protein LINPERHAP1_LOCUS31794 [Linum perenne]
MIDCLQMRSGGKGRRLMANRVQDVDILWRQSCMCCETVTWAHLAFLSDD